MGDATNKWLVINLNEVINLKNMNNIQGSESLLQKEQPSLTKTIDSILTKGIITQSDRKKLLSFLVSNPLLLSEDIQRINETILQMKSGMLKVLN